MNRKAEDLREQAEKARTKGRTGLFDYVEEIQQRNLENISRSNNRYEEQAKAEKELQDRYAGWAEELSAREEAIKQKEAIMTLMAAQQAHNLVALMAFQTLVAALVGLKIFLICLVALFQALVEKPSQAQ